MLSHDGDAAPPPPASNGDTEGHPPTPTGDTNEHLPDSSGFAFTPTLRTGPTTTTSPANNPLGPSFAVCIIGASRGIGAAIALAYACAGAATLILTATTRAGLASITDEIRSVAPAARVLAVACDVSQDANVHALAQAICTQVPGARLDAVVVNAAHYGELVTDITGGSPAEFQKCMDINATGVYLAAHHLVPLLMATQDGARTFLGVSSLAAWLTGGLVAHLAVCVSKLAQVRVIEHLAEQYGDKGICALSVHPGCVKTDMAKAAPPEFEKCESSADRCRWTCSEEADVRQTWLTSLGCVEPCVFG